MIGGYISSIVALLSVLAGTPSSVRNFKYKTRIAKSAREKKYSNHEDGSTRARPAACGLPLNGKFSTRARPAAWMLPGKRQIRKKISPLSQIPASRDAAFTDMAGVSATPYNLSSSFVLLNGLSPPSRAAGGPMEKTEHTCKHINKYKYMTSHYK